MSAGVPDTVPVLETRDVRRSFRGATALDGLSMALVRGEWVGLLGPNGAGKTTLMRAIAGLCSLDGGRIALLGREVSARRSGAQRAAIGFVPQELALYPLLTVRENLEVFARIHGLGRLEARSRIAWALYWTALAERASHLAQELSGGMKRRLNIACGVLHSPAIVLLDEPTVGVDPQARERIFSMLRELRDSGTTLLQSTHQMHEVEQACDRMLIVDRGRVIAVGTVEELVRGTLPRGSVITIELDGVPGNLESDPRFSVDGRTLEGTLEDAEAELPQILSQVRTAGRRIESLRVTRPGLADVFEHLTGRELRE